MRHFKTQNNSIPIPLADVPTLTETEFTAEAHALLTGKRERFVVTYFAHPLQSNALRLFLVAADQQTGDIFITSHVATPNKSVQSLSASIPSMAVFEREIHELHGLGFVGHPWLKPVRYPAERAQAEQTIDNYPFYNIDSTQLHQVNVGPVHAGIIEPGVFRFLCEGETIFHLEIALGFQHRGIEKLITASPSTLTRMCLAEQIAGDTTAGHATAMALILEQGQRAEKIDSERIVALEMERIAMHIADTGALCGDIAYQLGQTACEALRTIIVNTMQQWCGNRFSRTLIRPHGTNYHLQLELIGLIRDNISEVAKRYKTVSYNLFNTPTVLARIDEVCTVRENIAYTHGAVGMAAKSCGLERDCRGPLAFAPIEGFAPLTETTSDLAARLRLRTREVAQSVDIILAELKKLAATWFEKPSPPQYNTTLSPNAITISLVEGWRGMICHCAVTGANGDLETYKIYDPSMRNWLMLAQSVRGAEISDFPLSNKSFNLSYCGNDL